ncbi:MAG: hypothetical protein MI974_17515 [Chitinophagales bacterium]|nr:hypothetical protein [Chitinophagales bacterium]
MMRWFFGIKCISSNVGCLGLLFVWGKLDLVMENAQLSDCCCDTIFIFQKTNQVMSGFKHRKPTFRHLRAYAFDPSLSLDINTVNINNIVYSILWEDLEPGPIGEYVEVIDYDPTIKKFYKPIDLDHPYILAERGLPPSESNPQYHQLMVYAVAMHTIKNFEKALGRKILWSSRLLKDRKKYEEYVGRLRIYPHAMREANAYYSPMKKALLFGYFSATPANAGIHMPDALVFTCLSHDIVTHEVTHAILDGINRNYSRATNPDVLAFHEAFADIVALFQHFTFPDVLKHQIAQTRGNLSSQNLLGKLAQELGAAIGGHGSLRDALGGYNKTTGEWEPQKANLDDYLRWQEPHKRGSILVAAVFEAFLTIYKNRIKDLLRIASNGTGILPEGELGPDLVNRMATEASKAAKHTLMMCIRALDYCPPLSITFGDYLRAIITADMDLVKEDNRDYRLAFIDAFRNRGIYPDGIKTLSIDSLQHKMWNIGLEGKTVVAGKYGVRPNKMYVPSIEPAPTTNDHILLDSNTQGLIKLIIRFLKDYADKIKYVTDRKEIFDETRNFIKGGFENYGLHRGVKGLLDSVYFMRLTGLSFTRHYKDLGMKPSGQSNEMPSFSIQNLRLVSRTGPDGDLVNQVIFSIIQKSGIRLRKGKMIGHFTPENDESLSEGKYIYQGGCSLVFDIDSSTLKYVISKPLLDIEHLEKETFKQDISYTKKDWFRIDRSLVEKEVNYLYQGEHLMHSEYQNYFGMGINDFLYNEPFGFLHRHETGHEE